MSEQDIPLELSIEQRKSLADMEKRIITHISDFVMSDLFASDIRVDIFIGLYANTIGMIFATLICSSQQIIKEDLLKYLLEQTNSSIDRILEHSKNKLND
jgi:hypothetical protein